MNLQASMIGALNDGFMGQILFPGDDGYESSSNIWNALEQNYDRLVQLKRKYDSENLFRMNQNIKP